MKEQNSRDQKRGFQATLKKINTTVEVKVYSVLSFKPGVMKAWKGKNTGMLKSPFR